jgi:hypothetical protein
MALVPFLSAARFSKEVDADEERSAARTVYRVDETAGTVTGPRGKELRLPARVVDASQGTAVYMVERQRAQSILDDHSPSGVSPFIAVDTGRNRTPFVVFAVEYRKSDLGDDYLEFGTGFTVVPRHNPRAVPGLYVRNLLVNNRFSWATGGIWGYPKSLGRLDVNKTDSRFRVRVLREPESEGGALVTAWFPRGGSGSTTQIPLSSYTLKAPQNAPDDPATVPHETVFLRTGRGERIRQGGEGVEVRLSSTRDDRADDVWSVLDALEIKDKPPVAHSWTERMSGEFFPSNQLRTEATVGGGRGGTGN